MRYMISNIEWNKRVTPNVEERTAHIPSTHIVDIPEGVQAHETYMNNWIWDTFGVFHSAFTYRRLEEN
jgi:hypothetical protein